MPKQRNTDTEIWKDPWFRRLPALEKVFWRYLCDNVDDAGVWKEDLEMADFQIGEKLDKKRVLSHFNTGKDRVKEFKTGYWVILDFVSFHYGGIDLQNPTNNFHKHVSALVKRHGIEGLVSPSSGAKDKDNGTYKGKGLFKDGVLGGEVPKGFVKPTFEEVTAAMTEGGLGATSASIEAQKFLGKNESIGWVVGKAKTPMVSWRGAVATWLGNLRKYEPDLFKHAQLMKCPVPDCKEKAMPREQFMRHQPQCEKRFKIANEGPLPQEIRDLIDIASGKKRVPTEVTA